MRTIIKSEHLGLFNTVIFFLFLANASAQEVPVLEWAKAQSGTGSEVGRSITTDAAGNVFTSGYFDGTVDFDPGAAAFDLTSAGSGDIFISKLDASGNFVWAKQLGGTGNDQSYSITTDAAGNVITTGLFNGTADFDPGTGAFNLTPAGSFDVFISKLDASGNFVWAIQLGGTGFERGKSIATDASGNVFTTGYFDGTADFDPGAGTFDLTTAGSGDIFISKLDASGNFVWAKQLGGTGFDEGFSITIDGSDNVLTTGDFRGIADFDPGTGAFNLTVAGLDDIFISKLDASGNFVWAKQLGGTGYDECRSINTDEADNVFTTGYFEGTVNFDPNAGAFNLTSSGIFDIFISKLNASGNFVWAKQLGGPGGSTEEDVSITTDASGNVFTTGNFEGTVDFDPGAGAFNLTSAGGTDIFISKLNGAGSFVWATRAGGTGFDEGFSITTDDVDNVFTTGFFRGTSDFDPGLGVFNLTSAGNADIFVYKLSQSLASCVPASERNALIALYNSTDGPNWTNDTNWLSADESTWFGVTVTGCNVTRIELTNNNLNNSLIGPLPSEIGDLSDLIELDLSFNHLTGSLPNAITNLNNLEVLKLDNNGTLSGPLPANIGNMTSLREIITQVNSFTGPIPPTLINCTALENLHLEGNQHTGIIPSFLGTNLTNLYSINLAFNQLTGYIPVELGLLTNLTYLSLADNDLFGGIPSQLGNLASLGVLDLSRNQLSGNIPIELGSLSSLGSLQLWDNQLSGNIPNEFINLTTLQEINLSQNQLDGTVTEIGDGSALRVMLLAYNQFDDMAGEYSAYTYAAFTHIDISDNHLASTPTFTAPSIVQLKVENNYLDFGDLEPNMVVAGFTYSPQAKLPPGGTISFAPGGTLTIPFTTPGTANSYDWKNDGISLGINTATLVKPGMALSDAGFYYVWVTSSVVPGLILESMAYLAVTDPCAPTPRVAGDLDTPFDPVIDVNFSVEAVAIQSTGKIIVSNGGIVRLHPDGSVDNSFTTSGYNAVQLIVQPDDKIIFRDSGHPYRLNSDGTDDAVFNTNIPSYYSPSMYTLGLQPDGKILVALSDDGSIFLDRLNSDGTDDATFTGPSNLEINVIEVQPDGKILLGGNFPGGIMRLHPTGAFDTGFNESGANGSVTDIAVQTDGKIIVVGFFDYYNNLPHRGIVRINPDGTLDNSFNLTGISDLPGAGNYASKIAIQSDSKIVLVGIFDTINGASRKNLVRLNADGSVDCSFDPAGSSDGTIFGMVLQTDEKILITGAFTTYDGVTRNGLARVNNSSAVINITTQPTDATICTGASASFATAATGTSNITFQWQRYTVATSVLQNIANGGAYSGTATSTLTINPSAGPLSGDFYRCAISGDNTATVFTNFVTLTTTPGPLAPITTGATSCSAASLNLTTAGGTNGQYRWYTVATGGTAIAGELNGTYATPVLSATTTYYVAINDGTCESGRTAVTATINTTPSKPSITSSITPASGTVSVCSSNVLTLAAQSGFTAYAWSNGATTDQITASVSGIYSVTVTNAAGCVSPDSDAITVTVIPAPCNNQPPVITTTQVTTQVEGSVTVDLVFLISDADNNIDLPSLKIIVQPLSGAPAAIDANGNLTVNYTGIAFSGTDVLTIEVCDLLGDCVQQQIEIDVVGDIIIYDGISPNGDNQNPIFYIQYIDVLADTKNNRVTIYNRWGDAVFETSNYDNVNSVFTGFNKNGNELPSGTYFYKIEFESGRPIKTGYLSLKR